MRSIHSFVAFALCFLSFAMVFAQIPTLDIRKETAGTSAIAGVVQTGDGSMQPLRRSTVRLSGNSLVTPRVIVTGDNGEFEFSNLTAGQYTLAASRANYQSMAYGAKRPDGPGLSIVLGDGQRKTDIVMQLPRYGVISGIVYDQNGEPAQGIAVEVLRYTMRSGSRQLSAMYGQPQFTDDRGVYNYSGLGEGEYWVAAGPSTDLRAAGDLQQLTVSDVDRALQAGGASPLNSTLDAQGAQGTSTPRPVTFAPVFFSGTTDFAGATAIALKTGEERTGIDIHLQLVPTAKIDGTVLNPDGQPVSGVQLVASAYTLAWSLDLFRAAIPGTSRSDANGHFTYSGISPGQYMFVARSGTADAGTLWATELVTVNGTDQNITLRLHPGMTVSGRLVFDGTTIAAPRAFAGLNVNISAVDVGAAPAIALPAATVNSDGTFTFRGVPPGRFRLTSSIPGSSANSGWSLRSAIAGGVDSLDGSFEVRGGENVNGAAITFTDHPTELSGQLVTPAGEPTSDYFLIVFAADQAFWTPRSRRIVMARPSTAGKYSVRNLPPGDYFVAAVTDVAQNEWFDPAFLNPLVAAATRIKLVESEKKIQDLRIGP